MPGLRKRLLEHKSVWYIYTGKRKKYQGQYMMLEQSIACAAGKKWKGTKSLPWYHMQYWETTTLLKVND